MSTPSFGKRRNHVRRTDRSSRRQGGRPHPPTTRAVAAPFAARDTPPDRAAYLRHPNGLGKSRFVGSLIISKQFPRPVLQRCGGCQAIKPAARRAQVGLAPLRIKKCVEIGNSRFRCALDGTAAGEAFRQSQRSMRSCQRLLRVAACTLRTASDRQSVATVGSNLTRM